MGLLSPAKYKISVIISNINHEKYGRIWIIQRLKLEIGGGFLNNRGADLAFRGLITCCARVELQRQSDVQIQTF